MADNYQLLKLEERLDVDPVFFRKISNSSKKNSTKTTEYLSSGAVDIIMGKKNEDLEKFLSAMNKSQESAKLMRAAETIKALFDIGIDGISLTKLREQLLANGAGEDKIIPVNEFIDSLRSITGTDTQDVEKIFISFLQVQ